MSETGNGFRPVFVFGISGATWDVIDPLLAKGRLPNLARLLNEGCRATLLSERVADDEHYRPQIAWASLATGCTPEHHGIQRYWHTADDLRRPALWHIFAEQGHRVGVYGWPLDWPPPALDGFVIPSHWARDARTQPPGLAAIKQLDRAQQDGERRGRNGASWRSRVGMGLNLLQYRPGAETALDFGRVAVGSITGMSPETRALLLRHTKLSLSADIFRTLYRRYRPGFASFHTFLVDFASHRYWRYFEPCRFGEATGSPLASAVEYAYIRVDRAMGRLLAELPDNANVAVISEHGMAAEPRSGEVGRWRYVIRGDDLLDFIGFGEFAAARPVARWVSVDVPDPARRQGLAGALRAVLVQETSLPLLQVIEHRDEIVLKLNLDRNNPVYSRVDLERLTITFSDRQTTFSALCRRLGRARSAMHDERGILVIRGPGIAPGTSLQDARLPDVAPTLVKLAGLKPANGFDGHPIDLSGSQRQCPRSISNR